MIALLAALMLAATGYAERLTLLSFNMGGRSRTAAAVADMIAAAGADVAFLQEVWVRAPQNAALHTMAARLGDGTWDFAVTSAYQLTEAVSAGGETYAAGRNSQNNAILYDAAKVTLDDLADEAGFTRFDGGFRFDKNTVQLVRIAARGDPERWLYAINVHLPYTDRVHRARDLATLERLYARCKQRGGVVIAGDFNIPRGELTTRNFDFVDGTERWFADRNAGIATTLSTKGNDRVVFASDYDHFVYSPRVTVAEQMRRAFTDARGRTLKSLPFGTTVYTNSVAYRKEVSDHVPIVIVLDL